MWIGHRHKRLLLPKKDEPHLHFRHSPAIEDIKLHRISTRRKAILITQNWISHTDYVVHQVQQNINRKSEKNLARLLV